jgi:predicted transcriptional regulator
LDLSVILASSCRQKILRVLSHFGEIRIMKLLQKTGCAYNEVMRNLRILGDESIITYRRLGRKCIINLNHDNVKTIILIKALRILDTPIDSK